MMTVKLTAEQAARYDADDESLMTELRALYGRPAGGKSVQTEVVHPDGFVVEGFTHE